MKKFEVTETQTDGTEIRLLGRALTAEGVALLCPSYVPIVNVKHICEMANQNPDYPYDLAAWQNSGDGYRFLKWSARVVYKECV